MSTDVTFIHHLLRPVLCVPKDENAKDVTPLFFDTSDGVVLPVFSEALKLAKFFGQNCEFIELPVQAVLAMALDRGCSLGVDLEDSYGQILDQEAICQIIDFLKSRESLIEIEQFEFVELGRDQKMIDAIQAIVPENCEAWLTKDLQAGYILFLATMDTKIDDDKHFKLRQNLLEMRAISEISLVIIDSRNEKWKNLRPDVGKYGANISRTSRHNIAQPPNLKKFAI